MRVSFVEVVHTTKYRTTQTCSVLPDPLSQSLSRLLSSQWCRDGRCRRRSELSWHHHRHRCIVASPQSRILKPVSPTTSLTSDVLTFVTRPTLGASSFRMNSVTASAGPCTSPCTVRFSVLRTYPETEGKESATFTVDILKPTPCTYESVYPAPHTYDGGRVTYLNTAKDFVGEPDHRFPWTILQTCLLLSLISPAILPFLLLLLLLLLRVLV